MMALNPFALKLITHCCVRLAYVMHVKNFLRKINVCLKLVGEFAAWLFVLVLVAVLQHRGRSVVSSPSWW